MAKTDKDVYQDGIQRFVKLANEMKDEGIDIRVVSSSLMSASAVFAIYAMVGNEGLLTPAGLDKVTEACRQRLDQIQQAKKEHKS